MATTVAATRMIRRLSDERASDLAKEAIELSQAGDRERASRKLREAASFGHNNATVQQAFLLLHSNQTTSPLLDLCRRYAQYHDKQAGDDAVQFLGTQRPSGDVAVECLKLLLESKPTSLSPTQDIIISELARQSQDVRLYMCVELQASTTEFFDNLYERGDQAANCLRAIVLEAALWPEEGARIRVEEDLFQLFIAKLMESGHDLDGRALKGIALLLMADAPHLQDFVDEEGFDALLTSLEVQLPADVRGQATLVISKYLEVAEAKGQTYFTRFVISHVKKQKGDDLVLAFSAAAALFPVATQIVAPLFLTEGFLPGLMPSMDRKTSGTGVHDAFLTLLNSACIDSACRAAISTHCLPWLSHKVSNGSDKQNALAATILAKLRTAGGVPNSEHKGSNKDDVSDLVDLFQSNLHLESDKQDISNSIEGLAYTSLKPEVKDRIAKDTAFLKTLLKVLEANAKAPEVLIGGLSTIANVTTYPPNLSEEQKRISQLKAYANASKPAEPSSLENESHVSARCTAVINAGAVPTLVALNKATSNTSSQLIDKILLSLSKNSKDRGKIAQQGAVKLLVSHLQKQPQKPAGMPITTSQPATSDAAHALARILISLDPTHIFPASGTPSITDAIPPLVSLLKRPTTSSTVPLSDDGPRDLLPTFESLLGLTNLASAPDKAAAESIIKQGFDTTEDLMLSSNTMIRRAAVELVCNLCTTSSGIAKFADSSAAAKRRCHLMLAMADVEDLATRRAAGGGLAMLTEFEEVVQQLLEFARIAEIVLGLIEDEDLGVRHRGLVVLLNLLQCDDKDLSTKGKALFKKAGASEMVKDVLRQTKEPGVLGVGVEVVKMLQ